MLRHLIVFLCVLLVSGPVASFAQDTDTAQDASSEPSQEAVDRSTTGGAQTLEDILRRQAGEKVDDSFRSENTGGEAINPPEMAPIGGASDADLWRALRYNKAPGVEVSTHSDVGKVMIQDGGMGYLETRSGPLRTYGGWLLLGTMIALVLFFVIRGRVKLDQPMTGRTVTRFKLIERLAHWITAVAFICLGITGLLILFGRVFLIDIIGKDANAAILSVCKFVHDYIAWAFIVGLVMMFVMWVVHNIPTLTDLKWFAQGGGIIGKKHPPAGKFNGGQKIIFWCVILLGGSIALSGLSLLFPYELPLFSKTFGILNSIGVPGWFGMDTLPVAMSPQEEMQFAQLWHAIVAFVLMAIIIAHIYIGTVGMEGAFDAMGSGEVDEAWADQHHSLWLKKLKEKESATTPAE